MKRGVFIGLGITGFILIIGAGAAWSLNQPATHAEPVDISFGALGSVPQSVRLAGTAHYVAHVKQEVAATLFSDATTIYSYGLFPKGDVTSKEIQVLVRTDHPLPRNIDFEYIEFEGILEEPTRMTMPFQMERVLGERTGYFFSPDILVLRPHSQRPINVE